MDPRYLITIWIALAVPETDGERISSKRALVIGVGSYPEDNGWRQLPGATRDAARFAQLLVDRFQFQKTDIVLLQDRDATRVRIVEAFEKHLIEGSDPETSAIFYYAGHGSQVLDDDGDEGEGPAGLDETICPVDSLGPGDTRNDLRDDTVASLFRRLTQRAGQVVGVFDCCHSGTAMREAGGEFVGRQAPIQKGKAKGGSGEQQAQGHFEEFRVTTDNRWPGRNQPVFISACLDHQLAYESEDPPRGVFSDALVTVLRTIEPGTTWGTVCSRVRSRLYRRRHQQVPQLLGPRELQVFGSSFTPQLSRFEILQGRKLGGTPMLTVSAGLLHGLEVGTRLHLVSSTQTESRRTAIVRRVGLTESSAELEQDVSGFELVEQLPERLVEVLEGPAPSFQTRVRLPEKESLPEHFDLLTLEHWLETSPYYVHPDASGHDLEVSWDAERGFVVFDKEASEWYPHPIRGTKSPSTFILDMASGAVYRSVRTLENATSFLQAKVDISFELGNYLGQQKFVASSSVERGRGIFDEIRVSLKENPALCVTVMNRHSRPVYVHVFSLMPNWAVKHFNTSVSGLPPGELRRILIMLTEDGWRWGTPGLPPEIYKVVVTESDEQMDLVETIGIREGAEPPPGPTTQRHASLGPKSSLGALLRAAGLGGGLRCELGNLPPLHWTTEAFELTVLP